MYVDGPVPTSGSGNAVVDAIKSVASNNRVLLAMLMGSKLEGGWTTSAAGDGGTSFGPFQIHLPAHPGVSKEQAMDPVFAAKYMLKSYEAGVNRVDAAMWNANPAMAAATAAFYAERPKVMYPTARITAAWNDVQSAAAGGAIGGGGVDSFGGLPDVGAMWDTIWKGISHWLYDTFGSAVNVIYFGLMYGVGGLTVAVGAYLLFKDSTRVAPTVKAVASGYGAVMGRVVRR